MDATITTLNRLFRKDSKITKYQAFKSFMTFKRPFTMSIQVFLNGFYKCLFKTKTYGTTMSNDILAYHLLKSANLSTHHEELIKAAIPDLHYNIMKDQLKKTFSDASRQILTKTEDIIKLKKPSWLKNSAIRKSSMSICKTHYHQNMNTTHLEIQ